MDDMPQEAEDIKGEGSENEKGDDSLPWSGRLWVRADIGPGPGDQPAVRVSIWGNPEGLRSLGGLLVWLADADQRPEVPEGEHFHQHLWPKSRYIPDGDIEVGSCPVTVGRADACGTGKITDPYLIASRRAEAAFTPDSLPPDVWMTQCRTALTLARQCHSGTQVERIHVCALSAQAAFYALMAVLRSIGVSVPHLAVGVEVTDFLPRPTALPVPIDEVRLVLMGDHPVPDFAGLSPDDEEIEFAFERAEKVAAWAEERMADAPR